eukprot:TRINITY_DN578_c0_g1_i1.p1 TRINITY_DN578_c0_g1~~TRINITY_DN578_c0_g1_i1.p1  ORF type:complete len:170 (-),score=48.60 TRINITY_DN578_c0_g1_i1:43-552(-)
MGQIKARKHGHNAKNKSYRRGWATKNRTKDIDQIAEMIHPDNLIKTLERPLNPLLPSYGQFYCTACDRYFKTEHDLEHHAKSKPHKRRLKQLSERPYSQVEAEWAAGMQPDDHAVIPEQPTLFDEVIKPPRALEQAPRPYNELLKEYNRLQETSENLIKSEKITEKSEE